MRIFFSKVQFLFVLFGMLLLSVACNPETDYPAIPYIDYRSCSVSPEEDVLHISFYFQDGDGNIGFLGTGDTFAPYVGEYRHNLHLMVLDQDSSGVFFPFMITSQDTAFYNYRINYIEPESRNHSLKGTMEIAFSDLPVIKQKSKYGIIRFQLYLYDRDLQKSNIILTPPFSIN